MSDAVEKYIWVKCTSCELGVEIPEDLLNAYERGARICGGVLYRYFPPLPPEHQALSCGALAPGVKP